MTLTELPKEAGRSPEKRRVFAKMAAVGVLGGLGLAGAAAAGWLHPADEVAGAGVGCFAAASLEADTVVVDAVDGDPVETCVGLWEQGTISQGVPPQAWSVCIGDRALWVFPGADLCGSLGLETASVEYLEDFAQRSLAWQATREETFAQLHESAVRGECQSPEDTADLVVGIAHSNGFEDLTASVQASEEHDLTGSAACGVPLFDSGDPADHEVQIAATSLEEVLTLSES